MASRCELSYPERFGATLLKHFVGVLEPAGEFVRHELSLSGVPDAPERNSDDHALIRLEGEPHCSEEKKKRKKLRVNLLLRESRIQRDALPNGKKNLTHRMTYRSHRNLVFLFIPTPKLYIAFHRIYLTFKMFKR